MLSPRGLGSGSLKCAPPNFGLSVLALVKSGGPDSYSPAESKIAVYSGIGSTQPPRPDARGTILCTWIPQIAELNPGRSMGANP